MWYYCELCNKNRNMQSDAVPICPKCSNLLIYSRLNQPEIKRREKERITFCDRCGMMVYAVSIEDALKSLTRTSELGIKAIMRTVRKKKQRNIQVGQIKQELNYAYQKYVALQRNYQYACMNCSNGLLLNQKQFKEEPPKSSTSDTPEYFYCEMCGVKNQKRAKFCKGCGINLEYIKVNYFNNQGKEEERSRHIPAKIRYDVYKRDDGKCVMCGSSENIQFDHIIPFSKGGAHSIANLQLLCQDCNLKKSDRLDI